MASTPPPAKKARVEETEEAKPEPKEAKPVLYSYWRSSCSWRVRIALAVKNVDYDYVAVNLLDGEQKSDEHVKNRNVMAQVPAFVVGDKTISQSMAILEYIEEKYEGPALLPKDLTERAQVREICNIIGSGIQPIQNLAVMKKIGADHGDKHKVPWNNYWITKGFEGLEILLAKYVSPSPPPPIAPVFHTHVHAEPQDGG